MNGLGAAPPEVTINAICEAFSIDPVRALEIWADNPKLIIAVLDVKAAKEAWRMDAEDPRSMSSDQVDFMSHIDGLATKYLKSTQDPEKVAAEKKKRDEVRALASVPF